MELLQVDLKEEARAKMLAALADFQLTVQPLPLLQALGLTLAEDMIAQEDIPGFTRSTVDGYAVRAADTAGAGEAIPAFLSLVGSVEMGQDTALTISAGQCAYVPTGGILPQGADAMVMVEYCERFDASGLAVYTAVAPGRNLTLRGDDATAGALLLRQGTRIRAQEIGVLAAAGFATVPTYKPLRLAIISTGDELVPPQQTPKVGEIRDVNTLALSAQALAAGYDVTHTAVVKDHEHLISEAVRQAMPNNDIVVVSGGSSQGEKDATARIIDSIASQGVFTHGLALKPGKPTIIGYDKPSQTLLLGLPGHPVSAMMVFELMLGWLWRRLTGNRRQFRVEAVLERNIPGAPGKDTLQLVALHEEQDHYLAVPVWGKSGLISRLALADGYVVIDHNQEGLLAGTSVPVHLI